jgi:hypothetical protein
MIKTAELSGNKILTLTQPMVWKQTIKGKGPNNLCLGLFLLEGR